MLCGRWAKLLALGVALAVARRIYINRNLRSFKGDVVVITGGGSGIGRLLALKFARLGARIAIWDINEAAAKAVGTQCSC